MVLVMLVKPVKSLDIAGIIIKTKTTIKKTAKKNVTQDNKNQSLLALMRQSNE